MARSQDAPVVSAQFETPGADPQKKKAPKKPATTAGTGDPHGVAPAAGPQKKKQPYASKNNINVM
ncbi:MAG TPA: hypothetical protein VGF75_00335 [Candidatus Saccharimonadales bacterium]